MGTFYKMALSSTELSNVYSHPCDAPDTTNLKLWLPLKSYYTSVSNSGYAEGTYPGSTIKDYSKYGATGTYVKNTSRSYDIAWDWTFDTTCFVNGTAACQWKDYKVADGYRFGYDGMEKDDEVLGEGNEYTTEFRQYDPRVGRWFSIDPKIKAFESAYNGLGNKPFLTNDPKGDEIEIKNSETNNSFKWEPGKEYKGDKDGNKDEYIVNAVASLERFYKEATKPKSEVGNVNVGDIKGNVVLDYVGKGKHANVLVIITNDQGKNNGDFKNGVGRISWDDHAGIELAEGGKQSPSVGLIHEFGHVWLRHNAPATAETYHESKGGDKNNKPRGGNGEEAWVLDNVEKKVAAAFGEAGRYYYRNATDDKKNFKSDNAIIRSSGLGSQALKDLEYETKTATTTTEAK